MAAAGPKLPENFLVLQHGGALASLGLRSNPRSPRNPVPPCAGPTKIQVQHMGGASPTFPSCHIFSGSFQGELVARANSLFHPPSFLMMGLLWGVGVTCDSNQFFHLRFFQSVSRVFCTPPVAAKKSHRPRISWPVWGSTRPFDSILRRLGLGCRIVLGFRGPFST